MEIEGGGNPPNPPNPKNYPLPWLRTSAIAFPKFNPDNKEPAENHIEKFILVVQTMNVQYEDVVCRLCPLTFEGKASSWYFSLV